VLLYFCMRINKFLALCRLGSRRGAEEIITAGRVKVNGAVVTDLATDIAEADTVTVDGKPVAAQTEKVYIMLNKPIGTVTTMNDPQGRRTVTDIIYKNPKQYKELLDKVRLFPVGRLDYNTGGLLLLTNDGELANKLVHPSTETKKVYIAAADRPISESELQILSSGVVIKEMRRGACRSSASSACRAANSKAMPVFSRRKEALPGASGDFTTAPCSLPTAGGVLGVSCKLTGGSTPQSAARPPAFGDVAQRHTGTPHSAHPPAFGDVAQRHTSPPLRGARKMVFAAKHPNAGGGQFAYKTAPAVFEYNDKKPNTRHIIRITIHEGRNRQIRKMFETIGAEVKQLQRIAEGHLQLGNLKPGEWRFVRKNEVYGKQ
jgi:pseudouridine synthase